ncbi:hypothetical protein [Streptomyces sp. NRRL B-24484]|uniref:hypothetical protein n=1 Tax=Streptomyces sp. NRRL B-24484 TaxID=1463833 RepID=UPI00069332B3|nr:hypothetical protein [Streptomyces sp. NRRL B-24484]
MEGFDAVADRLYSLPPTGFTAARTEAAAEARRAGDRALAGRIGALRRPTRSAWAVNLLVHTRPADARALLDLGASLRRAQAELAGPALRELSAERRRLVATLTAQVRDAAAAAGEPLGEAPLREVEQSLRAALASGTAAEAFAAGRMTGPLREDGALPTGDLPTGWGPPPPEPTAPHRPTAARTDAKPRTTRRTAGSAGKTAENKAAEAARAAEQEARRQRTEAERALVEAEQEERAAGRERTRLARAADRLAAAERKATDRTEQARATLRAAETEQEEARHALSEARQQATEAAEHTAAAHARTERARARLAGLPDS